MATDDELHSAIEERARINEERFHTYRFERFILDGFSFEEAEELERKGADYHVADSLCAASCPRELAMKILI